MEDQAELVFDRDRGQDDSATGAAFHVQARGFDSRRGRGQPRDLCVAAEGCCRSHRKGCARCSPEVNLSGNTSTTKAVMKITLPIIITALGVTSLASAQSPSPATSGAAASDDKAIRPFKFSASKEALADMRKRIAATRWPDKETVNDGSQGVQLATIQKLARYWGTDYDWRKCEAKLKALPQFITAIDGVDIHFIHVRSKHPNALPMIVTHGWPGSIIEQLKIIGPLTDPTGHGGKASDAFDVVIPSLPGYGFSGKPTATGWDPIRIARAWV